MHQAGWSRRAGLVSDEDEENYLNVEGFPDHLRDPTLALAIHAVLPDLFRLLGNFSSSGYSCHDMDITRPAKGRWR